MKKVSILLVMLLCISANIFAQDLAAENSDGVVIYYNIISSTEPRTVEVAYLDLGEYSYLYDEYKYAGVINIPESVTYDSNTYSVTSIGEKAFYDCSGLTSVTIPNSVTSIGEEAFTGCSGLTSITIPNSVTSIGESAFWGCTGLTSITIPNSVTSIGDAAFGSCFGLTSITIPNSVTSISDYAFSGCIGLTSITIPNSVTSIGDCAFQSCRGLTSITIPNSVISIGDYAFGSCRGLTSITIPNSVTSIGEGAFSACSSLTSITIGNSVTSIGEEAFSQCPLDTLRMKPENPPTIEMHTIDRVADIFVPCGCEEVYKSAPNWKFFKDNIQEDCSAIEEVAEETGIVVYPNPVMDNAVLSIDNLKEDVKVILTDEQGRQVSLSTMKAGEREINLNTSSLANGIYFVRIVGETIQRTEKIIKK